MSEPPETSDPEICGRFLQELGSSDGRVLPIAEAALALASFDRPRVNLTRYREHLQLLARDVGRHPGAVGDLAARARALEMIQRGFHLGKPRRVSRDELHDRR